MNLLEFLLIFDLFRFSRKEGRKAPLLLTWKGKK
ncbi:unknown protein [Simkania negevensis Z]|jgi:hypothetical protein|uniref:Uncharacterized protein n=1 Tax=Simkania negevensis (strain ATCC VR-1471 / DSM 27360 / Z) TaxID=331113 RepID=F8L6K4_SIMNZ|nr:unknown protein [Simkania negevensis Z]